MTEGVPVLTQKALLTRFCRIVSKGRFKNPPHVRLMTERLMRLANRDVHRDIVTCPPRHGKSMLRTVYFGAWYILNNPDDRVVVVSNSANLATRFTRQIRDIVEEYGHIYGHRVRDDVASRGDWELEGHEGGVYAVGIGGQLSGRGADVLLVDDPIKTASEAMSETTRENQWDWFASVADNRLEPDGIVCITMTRWHSDDLAGRLMEREPEEWDYLNLPALAEEDDPLGRKPGEALWPQRYGVAYIEKKRERDPFWFDAMQQGRPRPKGGGMFKREWFDKKVVAPSDVPNFARRVRHWDFAATEKGDWTVGTRIAAVPGAWFIEHVDRFRLTPFLADQRIKRTAERDQWEQGHVLQSGEQEPGSAGVKQAAAFAILLRGHAVVSERPTGPKAVRAAAFASQCQAGNVYLVDDAYAGDGERWNAQFVKELCEFPTGKYDDVVDSASGAFNQLLDIGQSGQFVTDGRSLEGPHIYQFTEFPGGVVA